MQHQSVFPELTRSRWEWVQKVTVGPGSGHGSHSEPAHKGCDKVEEGVEMHASVQDQNSSTACGEEDQLPVAGKAEVFYMR